MKPILRMIVCVSIALTSSCTHIPESAAHSEVYLRWVAEIQEKRQDPMNIRVAGYNSAIVMGRIATIETNELSNEVIAKSLTLDSPSILLSEFRVRERKILFLFSTPTVFDNILALHGLSKNFLKRSTQETA